jgi:hypothetical protein
MTSVVLVPRAIFMERTLHRFADHVHSRNYVTFKRSAYSGALPTPRLRRLTTCELSAHWPRALPLVQSFAGALGRPEVTAPYALDDLGRVTGH